MPKKPPKEITEKPKRIMVLAPKAGSKEIGSGQGVLDLSIAKDMDIGDVGMGVLRIVGGGPTFSN